MHNRWTVTDQCFLGTWMPFQLDKFALFLVTEVPAVVVGVVGMGHVPGIERNWEKELNIQEIMRCVYLS